MLSFPVLSAAFLCALYVLRLAGLVVTGKL